MTTRDETLDALQALLARADSMSRADGAGKSGKVTIYDSQEMNLGPLGWGEVEFYVTASYQFTFEFARIKSVDWQDEDDQPTRNVPRAAIETKLRRLVDGNTKRWVDELTKKL